MPFASSAPFLLSESIDVRSLGGSDGPGIGIDPELHGAICRNLPRDSRNA
jgi:hypothetical protein